MMVSYDLEKLTLIAQGGEADLYDIGDGKILRLSRKPTPQTAEMEQQLFQLLEENGINVPHLYETLEVNGMPGKVMQKISGQSLLDHIVRHPLMRGDEMKKFVSLQLRLAKVKCGDCAYSLEDVYHHILSGEPQVSGEVREFVQKIWSELPQGDSICHGDFHPGNILFDGRKYYLIDWSSAYRGRFVADIAHSYLLMKRVPEIPGESRLEYTAVRYWGARFAAAYFREVQNQTKIDLAEFSKWTVIMSFMRTYYGLPSEKTGRIEYLEKCRNLYQKQVGPEKWFEYI